LSKHPLTIVGAVFVAAVILYFLISPYQNCVREFGSDGRNYCFKNTAW